MYRGFNQAELDLQYAPSKWALRENVVDSHVSILDGGSAAERRQHDRRAEWNVAFAPDSPNTAIDILYPASVDNLGTQFVMRWRLSNN
jgi:hypothetical protein